MSRRPSGPRNLDALAKALASAATPLDRPTEVILALAGVAVMLAPHDYAAPALDTLAASDTPAAHAVELIDGGVALTPHLWGRYDPLLDPLRQATGTPGERAVGHIAELLASADPDQHCGDDAAYGPDLLGGLYSRLRSGRSLSAAGAFYTPPAVALCMAMVTDPAEHTSICDPAVGSGVMLWAGATAMRRAGRDPRTCRWYGIDTDPIAIAIATINTATWNLHDVTVLHHGNGLTATTAEMHQAERDRLAAGLARYAPDRGAA